MLEKEGQAKRRVRGGFFKGGTFEIGLERVHQLDTEAWAFHEEGPV